MTTPTAEVAEALVRAARRLRHASVHDLAPLGLTPGQERALRLVARSGPDGLRMGELATRMGVVPRSATGAVDGLEQAGLVERVPDPASRRSVLVRLTTAGSRIQRNLADARVSAAADLLGVLDTDELGQLAALLNRVAGPDPRPGYHTPSGPAPS